MSLKSKIEAVIYASEEPVTLQQLVGLLAEEAQGELDTLAANQARLPLGEDEPGDETDERQRDTLDAGTHEPSEAGEAAAIADEGDVASAAEARVEPEAPEEAEASNEAENRITPTEVAAPGPDDAAGTGPSQATPNDAEEEKRQQRDREKAVREHIRRSVDSLMHEYSESDRGIEIREVASGFRMGTKPEYHDAVRGFVKSLKPPLKLTLPALETLAVVAYKQPVTAAEISEIRGVDSAGVLGGLMARKLIATAGRKQVIGRPMLYKTTRDFLLRFGLKDIQELPSMEEFERMAGELVEQEDLPMESPDAIIEHANARGDAERIREVNEAEHPLRGEADDAEAMEAETAASTEQTETEEASNHEDRKATAESAAGGNDEVSAEERPAQKHSAEDHSAEEEPSEATVERSEESQG